MDNGYSVVNYDQIRDSIELLLKDELDDAEAQNFVAALDDAIGNNVDDLTLERDLAREKLIGALSYRVNHGRLRLEAQGASLDLTPQMLSVARSEGGIEIVEDVLNEPVDEMFEGPELGDPVRIRLQIDPIPRSSVHDHYGE